MQESDVEEVTLVLKPSYYNPYDRYHGENTDEAKIRAKQPSFKIRAKTAHNYVDYLEGGICRINNITRDAKGLIIIDINDSCASYGP